MEQICPSQVVRNRSLPPIEGLRFWFVHWSESPPQAEHHHPHQNSSNSKIRDHVISLIWICFCFQNTYARRGTGVSGDGESRIWRGSGKKHFGFRISESNPGKVLLLLPYKHRWKRTRSLVAKASCQFRGCQHA